jgi:fumarylacetoacetase
MKTKHTPWISIEKGSDFSIDNLPFGIFSTPAKSKRIGVAVGNQVLDVFAAKKAGLFMEHALPNELFNNPFLNDFIALGKKTTQNIRLEIQQELLNPNSVLKYARVFEPMDKVVMHLPIQVGDYTDFYSSIEHATNVGKMFRDPDNALLPNWKHLPVGYHGRASSIILSGQPIHRPYGQIQQNNKIIFAPSQRLDFELEMAFVVGKSNPLGTRISTEEADEYVFGLMLFNDWSARDIQKWEYVPLGPFLGKSFASSVSPWIVTTEALEPFRVKGPRQDPKPLPYLQTKGAQNYDIDLEVGLAPKDQHETIISQSNTKYLYWNMAQQLCHHSSNGCPLRVGDLMASGTISGSTPNSYGSMLELSWAGQQPLMLDDGSKRSFLEDDDMVTLRARASNKDINIGFGEVKTQILAAL